MSEAMAVDCDLEFMTKALAEIDATRKQVEDWWPTAHAAARAVEAAGDSPLKWRLMCGHSSHGLFGVLLFADDVTDLKHVLPLLRALRREGYRVVEHTDWEDIPSRTYRFKSVNEHEPKGPIVVRVLFPWDSERAADAACRFVQTGTKQVPVMEIICDGEKTPELVSEVTE